jgi:hypothetical protein
MGQVGVVIWACNPQIASNPIPRSVASNQQPAACAVWASRRLALSVGSCFDRPPPNPLVAVVVFQNYIKGVSRHPLWYTIHSRPWIWIFGAVPFEGSTDCGTLDSINEQAAGVWLWFSRCGVLAYE